MNFTGKIEKDFEEYLIKAKLWDRWRDSFTGWIYKIGDNMDAAAKRTAEQKNLKEEDYLW